MVSCFSSNCIIIFLGGNLDITRYVWQAVLPTVTNQPSGIHLISWQSSSTVWSVWEATRVAWASVLATRIAFPLRHFISFIYSHVRRRGSPNNPSVISGLMESRPWTDTCAKCWEPTHISSLQSNNSYNICWYSIKIEMYIRALTCIRVLTFRVSRSVQPSSSSCRIVAASASFLEATFMDRTRAQQFILNGIYRTRE